MLTGGQKMIVVIAVVSLGFAGYLVFPAMNITAQEQPEVFVTHSGAVVQTTGDVLDPVYTCLLYTSPSPRDGLLSRMPSSA